MRLLPVFIRRQIIRRTKHFRLSSSRRITRLSYKHCYNVELLYVICGWVWPGYVKRNLKGGGAMVEGQRHKLFREVRLAWSEIF